MSDNTTDYISSETPKFNPGPYLATVISHLDPSFMGELEVKLQRPVGNNEDAGQLFSVSYMSPFWGQTSIDYVTEDPNDYNNTQKSYGMWFVPPDVGTTVMVVFPNGNPKKGYWFGCIPDEKMNFMVPGTAATKYAIGANGKRVPVAEYNKVANKQVADATKVQKPIHPFADVLKNQGDPSKNGLLGDDIRGITTSSARREIPSMVFGISTPGPIDKRSGAKKGKVGKADSKVNAFVSRLGGSSFVMDDGDDKFIRKTHAKDGPPEYVAVEQGETGGNVEIPHNELVRIRTRTGHQILLHNSEDLIYITNSRGTAWIELTSNGKIDIYAKDSINVHSETDINFKADKNIRFEAGENIHMKAGTSIFGTAASNVELKCVNGIITASAKVDLDTPITHVNNLDVVGSTVSGSLATGSINGTSAGSPWQDTDGLGNTDNQKFGSYSGNPTAPSSAAAAEPSARIPQMEPWAGHENLHNTALKYTTVTDTFEQVKPPEKK